jgi:hypothetical protein
MLRFPRKTQRPADPADRTALVDLEIAQRRDPYAAGHGDRPHRRRLRPRGAHRTS